MKTIPPAVFLALIGLGACAAPSKFEPARRDGVAPIARSEGSPGGGGSPAPAIAQDYSPSALFYEQHGDFHANMDRFRPAFRTSFRYLPNSRIDGESGSFDQGDIEAGGDLRLVVGPDTLLRVGGGYEVRRLETSSSFSPAGSSLDETLHRVWANFGVGQHLDDRVYVEGTFSPELASDFDGTLHGDDWNFQATGIVTYEYSDEVYLKGGVHVDQVFDDVPVYPVAGMAWMFAPSWRVDVMLPVRAELSWEASAATTFTLGVELVGEQYEIRAPSNLGKVRSELITQEFILAAGVIHRFNDHVSAFGRFGGALGGDYDLSPPVGGKIDGQLDPTLMFEVGLGWDF